MQFMRNCGYVGLLLSLVALASCNKSANSGSATAVDDHDQEHGDHDHGDADAEGDLAGHGLGGWWCDEHGVPEEICARCDPKLVAEFKSKGDWCDEHNRPDSQCFTCHPEMADFYALQYEARAGKKPPKPTENGAGQTVE